MVCKQDLRRRQKITRDPPKMKKVRGNVITSVFVLNLSFFEFDVRFSRNKLHAFKMKRTLPKVNQRLRNCFKPQSLHCIAFC